MEMTDATVSIINAKNKDGSYTGYKMERNASKSSVVISLRTTSGTASSKVLVVVVRMCEVNHGESRVKKYR